MYAHTNLNIYTHLYTNACLQHTDTHTYYEDSGSGVYLRSQLFRGPMLEDVSSLRVQAHPDRAPQMLSQKNQTKPTGVHMLGSPACRPPPRRILEFPRSDLVGTNTWGLAKLKCSCQVECHLGLVRVSAFGTAICQRRTQRF